MATKPKKAPAPSKKISELPDGPADQHGLTPRQLKILQVIKTAVEDQGYPPSMREIGEKAGLSSTASVTYQLQILEEKGWIRRDASRGRAIEITLPGQDGEAAPQDKTRLIPLVGRIAAGNPILAEQEVEEVLPLPESIVGKGDLFLLQVKGDSMIDGEATVKTWSKKEGHFWLLPANDNYAPIPADNAEILGKVTAVLRSL